MTHFRLEQWADFAGHFAEPAAMQEHLDHGCAECLQALAFIRTVAELGEREAVAEPPAPWVRSAKALVFGTPRGRTAAEAVRRVLMKLAFDSNAEPALAGIRSAGMVSRTVVYTGGTYQIHMQIEAAGDSVSLMGQILDSSSTHPGLENVAAVLSSGTEVIASTLTNQLGEFQFDFHPEAGMQILFDVPKGQTILIPV